MNKSSQESKISQAKAKAAAQYGDTLPLIALNRMRKMAQDLGWTRRRYVQAQEKPDTYPQLGADVVVPSPGQEVGSGAHPSYRDPKPISALIEQVVAVEGWSAKVEVAKVFTRWAQIVGTNIAANAKLEEFTDEGLLVIKARNQSWMAQLEALRPQLFARLTQELGPNVVKEIQIHGPHQRSWKRGYYSVPGRGPRDTYD